MVLTGLTSTQLPNPVQPPVSVEDEVLTGLTSTRLPNTAGGGSSSMAMVLTGLTSTRLPNTAIFLRRIILRPNGPDFDPASKPINCSNE